VTGYVSVAVNGAFWSSWVWPLATAVLGFVFFGLVFAQWLRRRRAHQLAWSVGLLMYAVAAAMEAWSEWSGAWSPNVYRIYIVMAASLVGFLGLGSLYLLVRRRLWGHLYLGFLLACLVIFLVGVFATTLDAEKLVPGITVGGQALGPSMTFPRVMSLPFNITGSIFLIGGAVVSIWTFARRRDYSYRVWANVLIAAGALLIAFVGSRARLGDTTGLYAGEMVASALMLTGFLMAGTLDKGARARRAARAGGDDR
jgi:NADH:ubiquinone oxidoreductase subunit K